MAVEYDLYDLSYFGDLFDEEAQRKQYEIAVRKDFERELQLYGDLCEFIGLNEGMVETMAESITEAKVIVMYNIMETMNIPFDTAFNCVQLTKEEYGNFLNAEKQHN